MPVSPQRIAAGQLSPAVVEWNAALLHSHASAVIAQIERDEGDDNEDTDCVPFAQLKPATQERYRALVRALWERGLWRAVPVGHMEWRATPPGPSSAPPGPPA